MKKYYPSEYLKSLWFWGDPYVKKLIEEKGGAKESGVQYGNIENLLKISILGDRPINLFFRNKELIIADIRDDLKNRTLEEFVSLYGKMDSSDSLPNGYKDNVWVTQGISIETQGDSISCIKAFHPTTLEDYKAKFWNDPEWDKQINK